MPLNTIGKLLGATDELKALSARMRRLRELQTLYAGSAPRELAQASRVKNLKAGTLFVSADNAAVAAKLKQQAPSLLALIRKTESEITGLRIEVQVSGGVRERAPKSHKKPLGPDAIQKFGELAHRVENDGLKAALENLVHRHKPKQAR
jgi:hypothetical protein